MQTAELFVKLKEGTNCTPAMSVPLGVVKDRRKNPTTPLVDVTTIVDAEEKIQSTNISGLLIYNKAILHKTLISNLVGL